jgi:hypothetical protein
MIRVIQDNKIKNRVRIMSRGLYSLGPQGQAKTPPLEQSLATIMIGREEGTKLHETTTARPGASGEQPGLGLLDVDWNHSGPATTRAGTANVDKGEPCRLRSPTHDNGEPPVADCVTRSESSQRSSTPSSKGHYLY